MFIAAISQGADAGSRSVPTKSNGEMAVGGLWNRIPKAQKCGVQAFWEKPRKPKATRVLIEQRCLGWRLIGCLEVAGYRFNLQHLPGMCCARLKLSLVEWQTAN
jgi:hypothetical protein